MAREYGEKVEARIDRLEDRAVSKREDAAMYSERAREATRGIVFGQPILVGHHSEKRHRAALAKSDRAMHNAYDAFKESEHLERQAEAARHNDVISSDDPLAILKLIEKIARAEKSQALMKNINAAIRKTAKLPAAERIVLLVANFNVTEKHAAELIEPDFAGRIGFPDYSMKNNNANIRRMKERLEDIRGVTARRIEAANNAATTDDGTELLPGVEVVRNQLENRLQVVFPGKPSEAVRGVLKSRGFRWSPSQGAWQRQLTNGAEYALECALQNLRGLPEYQTVQVTAPENDVVEEGEFNTEWPYWLGA
jgi:hypothetical protein